MAFTAGQLEAGSVGFGGATLVVKVVFGASIPS
jgi:hypothetical protein